MAIHDQAAKVIYLEGYLPSYRPSKEWHFNQVRGTFIFEGLTYEVEIRGPRRTSLEIEQKSREEITDLFCRTLSNNFFLSSYAKESRAPKIVDSGTFQYGDTVYCVDVRGGGATKTAALVKLFQAAIPSFALPEQESGSSVRSQAIEDQMVVPAGKKARESHDLGSVNAFLPLHLGGTLREPCQEFIERYVSPSDPSVYLRLDGNPIISEADVLMKAIAKAPQNGVYLDFGFGTARTSNLIGEFAYPPHAVYAFDVGTGSPIPWNRPDKKFPAGLFAFKVDEEGRLILPRVDENVFLSLGLFQEELPKFREALKDDQKQIAFMCIDCETYESAKSIFDVLGPYLMNGAVIHFDEIQNFEGWEGGNEHLAFMELMESLNQTCPPNQAWTLELVAFNPTHQQAAFRLNLKTNS